MGTLPLFDLPDPPQPRPAPAPVPTPATKSGEPTEAAALRVAEAAAHAWHTSQQYGRAEVVLGALAAFTFIAPPPDQVDETTRLVASWDAPTTIEFVRAQWRTFLRSRPDLANPASPFLLTWAGSTTLHPSEEAAAHAAVTAALHAGLLSLTTDETRRRGDLFGPALTLLKADRAQAAQGAFYTPSALCDLMARMLRLGDAETIHEPAVGTGGMFRAAAQAMRDQGRDPARATWVGVDIDPLAIACAAVNAVLWGLGPRVLLGVGDALTDDWYTRALAQREETIALAVEARRARRLLDALDTLNP